MTTETVTITTLIADDGKILTNGDTYGTEVTLADNDSIENWTEIDIEDVEEAE